MSFVGSSKHLWHCRLLDAATSSTTKAHTLLRTIIGGGEFAEFLMVSSSSSVMAVSSHLHSIQCEWSKLQNADVIVWVEDRQSA